MTHVLNAAGSDARIDPRKDALAAKQLYKKCGLHYFEFEAQDALSYDMTPHLDSATRFMDAAEGVGGRCMVHCQAGINRSGFVVVAQHMLRERLPLLEAVEYCKRARGVILLNRAFQVQLVRLAHARGLLGPKPKDARMALFEAGGERLYHGAT